MKSYSQISPPPAPKNAQAELASLKAIVAKRSAEDVARFHWWATGGPVYRWNEMILDEMQEGFVTVPIGLRHLALFQVALDDAVAAARHHGKSRPHLQTVANEAAIRSSAPMVSSVSEYAAASAAAGDMLGYIFPARASHFAARAERSDAIAPARRCRASA